MASERSFAFCPGSLTVRQRRRRDHSQHAAEQPPTQMSFGQQKPIIARMPHQPTARFKNLSRVVVSLLNFSSQRFSSFSIDRHISFDVVHVKLKDSYSETGRPSIDPELLLRILLIGYLYGITSERKLVEELRMHLAWRCFTGLSFDQEIPHHSTFSKNRHGRFHESNLFQRTVKVAESAICQSTG